MTAGTDAAHQKLATELAAKSAFESGAHKADRPDQKGGRSGEVQNDQDWRVVHGLIT